MDAPPRVSRKAIIGRGLPGGTPFRKCPADRVGSEGSLDAADCCAQQESATGRRAGETW